MIWGNAVILNISRMPDGTEISVLLAKARQGDKTAGARAFELLYRDLRGIAGYYMNQERPGHTLQPTALVNEAYLRIFGDRPPAFSGRAHFLAVASRVMRHVLVEYARAKKAEKRGGGVQTVSLDEVFAIGTEDWSKVLVLNDAMERLSKWDPRQCEIVEMRFFGGLTEDEIASVLEVSPRTVKRDWAHARAWLRGEMAGATGEIASEP